MRREFALAAICMFVATPVLAAAARCNQPYAPQFRDGAGATRQDIMAMRDDAQTFIAASDIYQACLLKAGLQIDTRMKVEANQRDKVRVGKAFNAVLTAYKGAHKANASSFDDLEEIAYTDDD